MKRDPVDILTFIVLIILAVWLASSLAMCQLDKLDRRECRLSGGVVTEVGDEWRCQR